jgi:hypothetical protein
VTVYSIAVGEKNMKISNKILLACVTASMFGFGTSASRAQTVFEVNERQSAVNVMKGVNPKMPVFPKLTAKKGFIRGYVKDSNGKPLPGAVIGVRSTAVGGYYSGAQGKTDAKGYYEIAVPFGAASFYCAGYAIEYGEGRAAMGLHPADGEADSFASNVGGVENFVMLPYGIADPDGVQEQPTYCNNYYGGGFYVDYSVAEAGSIWNSPTDIPDGATVELALTPVGKLINGFPGRSFIIRKKASTSATNNFNVVNIPVGTYTVQAFMVKDGQKSALTIKETGPYSNQSFGLEPKEAKGKATLTFRPNTPKPAMATAAHGNWGSMSLSLRKQ